MATITAVITKHRQREDGTWNVKIRVGHKEKSSYIDTNLYVVKKQLDSKLRIKDKYLIDHVLSPMLVKYRANLAKIGNAADNMTAVELRRVLEALDVPPIDNREIDFIAFCREHIATMKVAGKESSTRPLVTVINSLIDFFGSDKIDITKINAASLERYIIYLKSPRTFSRTVYTGMVKQYERKGLSKAGLHNHLRDLRLLFNAARNRYNDEDLGEIRIKHYPFKKIKVGRAPATQNRDLSIDQIRAIRDCRTEPGSRAELARDLCMLSFYLCGMNAADMYELQAVSGDRLEYRRAKTRNKRRDEAFISIKVIDPARPLLEKYAGKLQLRYSATSGLNTAIDLGIKKLEDQLGFTFDFYSMRHSFGTIGRNVCRFAKDDVALAMNHTENTVTDIYIKKDWTIVDEVQAGVVGAIMQSGEPPRLV